MKIDSDVFVEKLIRELDNCYQVSSDVMTPTQVIGTILDCIKFAQLKALVKE